MRGNDTLPVPKLAASSIASFSIARPAVSRPPM
jgi:hypothetical protein